MTQLRSTPLQFRASAPLRESGDNLCERFRACREQTIWTVKEAADQIGCAPQLLGRIEAGSVFDTSDYKLLTRAAVVYGVNSTWLWAGKESPRNCWPVWL